MLSTRTHTVHLVLALCSFILASPANAADWPQFRGPKRDNVSPDKGLLKEWPAMGPKLVWKGAGVGQGFSSVAVVGDRVYTMGDVGPASYVMCLDRRTGRRLWGRPVGRSGGNYKGTRSTPTVDGKVLYALGQFGDLVCMDARTGRMYWKRNLPGQFGGQPGGWNYTESVLVDGNKLICTPGGRKATVVALDKRTGKLIWRCPVGGKAGYSSVVISEAGGVRQYVQLLAEGTVGIDARTGKLLWRYNRFAGNTANIPTPVVLENQVFTTAGYGKGGALLSLASTGAGINAKEEYYDGSLRNKHGGVVVVGDYVFGDYDDKGRPWCAEWNTGKIVWQKRSRTRGQGSASLTYADGNLYIRYDNGYVALVPASADGYEEKGVFKIPNSSRNSWAHPVVIEGKLYLREQNIVWCYDVKGK